MYVSFDQLSRVRDLVKRLSCQKYHPAGTIQTAPGKDCARCLAEKILEDLCNGVAPADLPSLDDLALGGSMIGGMIDGGTLTGRGPLTGAGSFSAKDFDMAAAILEDMQGV